MSRAKGAKNGTIALLIVDRYVTITKHFSLSSGRNSQQTYCMYLYARKGILLKVYAVIVCQKCVPLWRFRQYIRISPQIE